MAPNKGYASLVKSAITSTATPVAGKRSLQHFVYVVRFLTCSKPPGMSSAAQIQDSDLPQSHNPPMRNPPMTAAGALQGHLLHMARWMRQLPWQRSLR